MLDDYGLTDAQKVALSQSLFWWKGAGLKQMSTSITELMSQSLFSWKGAGPFRRISGSSGLMSQSLFSWKGAGL